MAFTPLLPVLPAVLPGLLPALLSGGLLVAQAPRESDPRQRLINQAERLSDVLEQRQILLSKRDAVNQGLASNPDLASAYQGISGRSWALISARRSWYPNIQIVGSSNALRSSEPLLLGQTLSLRQRDQGMQQRNTTGVAGPGVVLNWTFFDLRRPAAINQALENLRAEEFLFDIAARTLTLNLQVAYTTVQARSELLQRYDWLVEITREQVARARQLHAQGRLSRSALDQLLTEERLQLTRLLDRYQQLFLASNSLSALVATPPGRYVLASEPLTLTSPWTLGLDASLSQALALREEIQQRLALASRDRWAATRAINGYLPVFGLVGVSAYTSSQDKLDSQPPSSSSNWSNTLGLNFRWTVFDGGQLAADHAAFSAQAAQQQSNAESQRLQVSREVMNAYASFITARLAVENTSRDYDLARRSLLESAAEFARDANVTSLIQSFNLYGSAADKDVGAIAQYNTAVYTLYRSSAQWPPGVEPPEPAAAQPPGDSLRRS